MRWDLHCLIVEGTTNDAALRARWHTSFASRPTTAAVPDLRYRLDVVDAVPPPPPREPDFRQTDLLEYYVDEPKVVAHFPRYGQLQLDLAGGATHGEIVPDAFHTYGVFEDLVAVGLSPHMRRRGLFLIHAFAAAYQGRAVLLVGGIGAGKTTTGIALLNAGWQLLSNDSPIIDPQADVLSYPGLLAAYTDTFERFTATAHLASELGERRKVTVAARDVWPDVWLDQAPAGGIFFLQIESRPEHAVEPLGPSEALQRLLPHAIEQWDRSMIPHHLRVLRRLVEAAPAFTLRLGPDVATIPALLTDVIAG